MCFEGTTVSVEGGGRKPEFIRDSYQRDCVSPIQLTVIWSRLAKSCPVDCKRMVFDDPLLRVTTTSWIAHEDQEPVEVKVIF
jgi:hypothetical protein